MTTANSGDPGELFLRWPADANRDACVTNVTAIQWAGTQDALYLLLGHVAGPVVLTDRDRNIWEDEHPDRELLIDPVGAFFLTTERAIDLTKALAKHLGLTISRPEAPNVS